MSRARRRRRLIGSIVHHCVKSQPLGTFCQTFDRFEHVLTDVHCHDNALGISLHTLDYCIRFQNVADSTHLRQFSQIVASGPQAHSVLR